MKQILLFLLFSTFSFSQTLVVSDENLINTYISIENERLFLFYPDKLVDVNLKTSLQKMFYMTFPIYILKVLLEFLLISNVIF